MSILFGATCILAILFMATFMFIGIWLFIVALKAFQQLRYKNYILEKMYQKLETIADNNVANLVTSDYNDFFDLDNDSPVESDLDNIKDFDKFEKVK